MNCPGCGVEMIDLPGDDETLRKCGECGGLWADVSDLNRLLLHSNLPGLESLGGKVDPEALVGTCPTCLIDLVHIEGGDKQNPVGYDTCESCGGVFLEQDFIDVTDHAGAVTQIVAFFQKFSGKAGKKRAAGA